MLRVLGVVSCLMGVAIGGWVIFNLVAPQPEARGRRPLSGIGVAAAMVFVGVKWMRTAPKGKAGTPPEAAAGSPDRG